MDSKSFGTEKPREPVYPRLRPSTPAGFVSTTQMRMRFGKEETELMLRALAWVSERAEPVAQEVVASVAAHLKDSVEFPYSDPRLGQSQCDLLAAALDLYLLRNDARTSEAEIIEPLRAALKDAAAALVEFDLCVSR